MGPNPKPQEDVGQVGAIEPLYNPEGQDTAQVL